MHPSSLIVVVSRRRASLDAALRRRSCRPPAAASIMIPAHPSSARMSPVHVVPAPSSSSSCAHPILLCRSLSSTAGCISCSGENRRIQRQRPKLPSFFLTPPRRALPSTIRHNSCCWFSSQSSSLSMEATDDDNDDRPDDEDDTTPPTTLDPLTMDRIVKDLHRTAQEATTSSSATEDHPRASGGVVTYEQIQRLFLLYPEEFDPDEAEALGELVYVGRGGQSICPRTFLRAVQYAVAQNTAAPTPSTRADEHGHSHNDVTNINDNDDDRVVQDYLRSFAPQQHPLPLAGVPPDACWGAGRWAQEGTSPFVNPQDTFDRGLRRYAQAAHNRAHRAEDDDCDSTLQGGSEAR